jgi:hypothetical protein
VAKTPTHYDQLGVARNAPDEVIRGAYKALALKNHPDKNINNPAATAVLQSINLAYDALSDPQKRAEYDAQLEYQEREEQARMRQRVEQSVTRQPQPAYPPPPSGRGFTVMVIIFLAVATAVFFVYFSVPPSLRPTLPDMTASSASMAPVLHPKPVETYVPHETSEHELAVCIFAAAKMYTVPPALLLSLISAEGGATGEKTPVADHSQDLGLLQINSSWIPQLAKAWDVSRDMAMHRLRDDSCVNVGIGAWILQSSLISRPGDLHGAIALYRVTAHHADPKVVDEAYISKVIKLSEVYKSVQGPADLAGDQAAVPTAH